MLGGAEPGEKAQLLRPDQALAIPGLPLPSAGSRRGRGCRAGEAEPPGMGLGSPGCSGRLGLLTTRTLPGGGQVGWGTGTTPLGERPQKLPPKPSGRVLSGAEPA